MLRFLAVCVIVLSCSVGFALPSSMMRPPPPAPAPPSEIPGALGGLVVGAVAGALIARRKKSDE